MSHKPAHLLLVDDDPGLLKLLGLRLAPSGYSVVLRGSGAEGLRVLNREKVDLVISDLRMDEMDGTQLFAEIQKVQPGMPVIILTAYIHSGCRCCNTAGVQFPHQARRDKDAPSGN